MFTRCFSLILSFTATISFTQAQRFDPGFLVKTTGDTLRGEIENDFWVQPPLTVRFRSAPDATLATYETTEISSLALTNSRYFRRELLPLDRSAETQKALLPNGLVFNQKPESVLAEVLIEGPASLLRMALPGAVHYWVRRENQPFIELTERLYMRRINGRLNIVDGNNYKAQLYTYFGDCASVAQAAQATPYTAAGLISLVQAYNQECAVTRQPGTDFTLTDNPKRRIVLNGGILGGGRLNSLRLRGQSANGTRHAVLDGLNIDNRPHPLAGLYLDVLNGGRQVALHGDLTVSTFGQAGRLSSPAGPNGRYVWRGKLGTARLGARHFVPVGRQQGRFFYGAGVLLEYVWDHESRLEYASSGSSYPQTPFVNPLELHSLPYLELGWRQGRFTAALDVCPYSQISYYDPFSTGPNASRGHGYVGRPWSFSATVGFRLNADSDAAPKR